jgi:general L-amino acid transport system ATP-binding protein
MQGVHKWYGAFHVLRNVDLTVMRGERIVICGPSGSGKSTLIRCINRLEEHQKGSIRVDGIELTPDVKRIDEVRREVGMVFQNFNLFPHLTILENCTLAPIWVRKMPKKQAEEQAMHFLTRVRIPEQAAKYPGQLSGGQQQRVALARALVFEPDALLLDEPLGALDRQLRESLQHEIKDLQRRLGISILFVTHDQDEAMMMSDRIAVMQDGRIAQIGPPDELYLHPATPFVAGFLGETNMLSGTMAGTDGAHARVQFPGATLPARLPRDAPSPAAGEKITVAIRPERIRLGTTGLQGVIASQVFLGRHARLVVTCADQPIVVSHTLWPPPPGLETGAAVGLDWAAGDAQILRQEEHA